MGTQWLIATLAYVGFLLAGFTWLRYRTNLNQTIPTTNERIVQYQRLLDDFPLTPENAQAPAGPPPANLPPAQAPQAPDVSDKEPKTAEMLLEQAKIAYDRMFSDRSSMETRAGILVGLAAAATGASAFITGGKGITFTPLLGAAAIFAILSLSCLLFILRAKYNPQPNPASFVFPNTVWDEAMHFRICLVMAEDYSAGCVVLSRDMKKDSAAIFVATACLVAATAMVLANSAFPVKQPPSVTKCFIKIRANSTRASGVRSMSSSTNPPPDPTTQKAPSPSLSFYTLSGIPVPKDQYPEYEGKAPKTSTSFLTRILGKLRGSNAHIS